MRFKRFTEVLNRPTDAASLAVFRIVFGAVLFVEVCRYFHKGWIAQYFIAPQFYFSYPGLEWLHPWSGNGMYWHFAVIGVAALLLMLGIASRLSAAVLCLGFSFMFLIDRTHYLNHFYLICLLAFQFSIVNADRAFAVLPSRGNFSPRWQLLWVQFQVAVVYLFGGLAKISPDWLAGEPMRIWLQSSDLGTWAHAEWIVYTFSLGGLLLDLFVIPLLVLRKTRLLAAIALAAFHLFNAYFFKIGVFPWLMLLAIPLYFDPSWPRRFLRSEPNAAPQRPLRPTVLAALGIYASFQLLFPLRHYLYSDNVLWSGEGERFSWLMKLSHLESSLEFFAKKGDSLYPIRYRHFFDPKTEQ
ncbi:MAG: HTTM domain-containing protein [Bdellovibrionota bacterium]